MEPSSTLTHQRAFEALLKKLADAYATSIGSALPGETEFARQHVPSDAFRARMNRLLQRSRRLLRRHKRLILIAAVIALIAALSATAIAYRETISGFIIQVYEKYSVLDFSHEPSSGTEPSTSADITKNLPTRIPAGYKQVKQELYEGLIIITYKNDEGTRLLFKKQIKSGLKMAINTEGVATETLVVNGCAALYYANIGINNLIWEDGIFVHVIMGVASKDELMDMALSIR